MSADTCTCLSDAVDDRCDECGRRHCPCPCAGCSMDCDPDDFESDDESEEE